MNKLLVINAHPLKDSRTSISNRVLEQFMSKYEQVKKEEEIIEYINLYEDEIPMLNEDIFLSWTKLSKDEPLEDSEQRTINRMNDILKQFKSANKYVISYPLHNFNVTSKLKDYMDNILIAKETFKYTENGSVGLLKDGRSMILIQGSGGVYTNNDWYTEVEYSYKYLKSMFNFIGIEDLDIIRAQGTSIYSANQILEELSDEVERKATELALK